MCGRYYFAWKDSRAFDELRRKVEQYALFEYAQEEVFPSQDAVVLVKEGNDYRPKIMKWGMKSLQNQLVINARSETVKHRSMFKDIYDERCLIPCNGFYEWADIHGHKEKMFITKAKEELIYLAGFYNKQDEFVILTAESCNDMRKVHDRTPLIITQDQCKAYLKKENIVKVDNEDLHFEVSKSSRHETKQLSLFDDPEV